MRRWRLGKKRSLLSKSMNNVNHDMGSNSDLSGPKLRNASSISDIALRDEADDGEDVSPQQEDDSFASTGWITTGDEDNGSSNTIIEATKLQNGELKKDANSVSDTEDRTTGRYAPVYSRNIEYRSNVVKRTGHATDRRHLYYNAHSPRPSSLHLEQEFTSIKVSEKLTAEPDVNGNLMTTLEHRKRRVSVDVLRSQFAKSNSKELARAASREAMSKIPSITIESVDEEVDQGEDTVEQSGASVTKRPNGNEDAARSSHVSSTSTRTTQRDDKLETSSSLEDEDLAGVRVTNESSVEGESPTQASDVTSLVPKNGQKSILNDKATRRMLRLFTRLPLSEKAIDYYSCALFSDILLHGTLYITTNYIAFYSKIFYHVSRVLLPSNQIKRVAKVNTAKIIPNGIGIYLHDGRRFLFGSLLSRDATYNLLVKVAVDCGGMIINEAQVALTNGEEEMASTSEQSQTDQDGQSAHSSGSVSSTPSTEHTPFRSSLPRQSSSTSLEKVDEVDAAPVTATPAQGDGGAASAERKSDNFNVYGADENSSSDDSESVTSSSRTTMIVKNSNNHIQDRNNQKKERNEQTPEKKSLFKEILKKAFSLLWTPRSSVLNAIFCCVLLLLFASSIMLMYRLQRLTDELSTMPIRSSSEQGNLLELQQRLHSTAASELQKAIEMQIQRISLVRRALGDLVFDFPSEDNEGDGHTAPLLRDDPTT